MKSFTKALVGTVAAGAVALASAAPAAAQDRRGDRDRDHISAGEVIAGAVVLGGLAAVIASSNNDRGYRGDYNYNRGDYRGDYRNNDYRGGYSNYGGRDAVEMCVNAVERYAQRRAGSRAEVYEVRDIDRYRGGFAVEGRVAVRNDWRYNDRRSWRGNNDYRRGYGNNGWDEGSFSCDFRNGRVVDVDVRGIRGV